MTAPSTCNQGLPKCRLYGESTLITWKLTMKDLGLMMTRLGKAAFKAYGPRALEIPWIGFGTRELKP